MSFNLKPSDTKAIDMLLDRQRTVAGSGAGMDTDGTGRGFSPHVDPVTPEQLAAAEYVLGLLSILPVEDPPVGLVDKTLAMIERSLHTQEQSRPFRPAADSATHA